MAVWATGAWKSDAWLGTAWAQNTVAVNTIDTHDGFDEDSHAKVTEQQEKEHKKFKSARESLRQAIKLAYEHHLEPVATEVIEITAPYVERPAQVSQAPTSIILNEAYIRENELRFQQVMQEVLKLRQALEREAIEKDIENDDEDVILLLWH